MADALLEVTGLRAGYGPITVLHDVAVTVGRGEIVALIGANGAGKTTTLLTVSGVVRATAGAVRFDGADITNRPAHEVVRRGLAQSPEGRKIFPRLTVKENLEMGAYTRPDRAEVRAGLDRAYALFPILADRHNQPGGLLSGGQQQMLAIARALMASPRLLLLDEPSLGLAPQVVVQIFDAIKVLNETTGLSVLLVEQNANLALKVARRGYVLETGRVTVEGPAAELATDPRIRAAYLGE